MKNQCEDLFCFILFRQLSWWSAVPETWWHSSEQWQRRKNSWCVDRNQRAEQSWRRVGGEWSCQDPRWPFCSNHAPPPKSYTHDPATTWNPHLWVHEALGEASSYKSEVLYSLFPIYSGGWGKNDYRFEASPGNLARPHLKIEHKIKSIGYIAQYELRPHLKIE